MNVFKCFLIMLALGIPTISNAGVGKVTEQINSPGTINRNKDSITASKGTSVEMNDAIKTTQGKLNITFEDETKVQVNENSKIVIDDFVYDPKKGTGALGAKIALGTVRYTSGKIAHNSPNKVALATPTATIAVRGTDFTATVEELGQSTIILLPSCPVDRPTRTVKDIESNCKVGEIEVETDAGSVILNQPFQVTRVNSRSNPPSSPVILNLSEMAIGNLMIVSPPKELRKSQDDTKIFNFLDQDFLKEESLVNVLDQQNARIFSSNLERNYLENSFLDSLFEVAGNQLDEKLLEEVDPVLPDYRKSSGIIVVKESFKIELCRESASDIQCIRVPEEQNTTIYQTQGNYEFKNRINTGGNTVITVVQR